MTQHPSFRQHFRRGNAREPLDVAILDVNINNINGSEVYPVAEALAASDISFCLCHRLPREGTAHIVLRSPHIAEAVPATRSARAVC